jgi:hypothetical protein
MSSTLNITAMAEAREAIDRGIFVVVFVVGVEIVVALQLLGDSQGGRGSLALPAAGLALLAIQAGLVGPPRSALGQFCREPWRAYAFLGLALLSFGIASATTREPWLPLYLGLLSFVLAYPSGEAVRGLRAIGEERRAAADPALLDAWLLERPARSGSRLSEARRLDTRAPVLLLRSFRGDALKLGGSYFARPTFARRFSLEELLAAETERIGPVLAVGEPGERLPPLGAAREYLAGEDWQAAVGTLIEEAVLLVWVLGETEGLFWEFRAAVARRGLARLLIVLPPLRREADLELRWGRFVAAHADLLGSGFPRQLPGERALALFYRQEEPIFLVSRKRSRWHYALAIRRFVHSTFEKG